MQFLDQQNTKNHIAAKLNVTQNMVYGASHLRCSVSLKEVIAEYGIPLVEGLYSFWLTSRLMGNSEFNAVEFCKEEGRT